MNKFKLRMHSRQTGHSLRLAMFCTSLGLTTTVAATGWNQGPDSWIKLTELTLDRESYSRSAPDERAAFHVKSETAWSAEKAARSSEIPELDPELGLSARRRDELRIWGPWLSSTGVSDNARQLVRFIEDIEQHGLSTKAYGLELLKADIAARERAATIAAFDAAAVRETLFSDASDEQALAKVAQVSREDAENESTRLARLLNSTFVRVAKHLGSGTVDPRKNQRRMFRDAPSVDVDALMDSINTGTLSVKNALSSAMPTQPEYHRLVALMNELLTERELGIERTHVPEVGSMWVGHHHADIMEIKRRLIETGELPADTVLTPMFDADLKVAVSNFQERNGIPASGIVDFRTRSQLNTSVADAIEDAALSLERWRWMPRDLGDRHLFMNLPSYRLKMVDDGKQVIDMVVVIGSTQHPTPTFSRNMTYVDVNPTWTVPMSIAHNELLPRELKNPGYLRQRNFEFLGYRDGKYVPVDYDSVTPEDMKKRPFRYVIRQRPGAGNALGRMKFMMPNQYSIYFHDTQAKRLFELPDRAYSHGCIRLGDPEQLLHTMLGLDGKPKSYINRQLAHKSTRSVILETPVPAHIAYFTTWINEDGELQQRRDVYKQDDRLADALRAAGTLLTDMEGSSITASAERHAPSPTDSNDQV